MFNLIKNGYKQIKMKDSVKTKVSETSSSVWNAIPIWAKGVLVIGGAFITYRIVKGLIENSRLSKDVREDKQEEQGWYQELETQSQSNKPTLSKTQMKSIANKIEHMLDGYGTRDYDLKQTFKMNIKNNADFAGVNAAFGIRTIEGGYMMGWAQTDKGTMSQMLQEADSSTLVYINNLMKSRGIKYRV